MNENPNLDYSVPLTATIISALLGVFTYNDPDFRSLFYILVVALIASIIWLLVTIKNRYIDDIKGEHLRILENTFTHNSHFGNNDLMFYFDTAGKKVIICTSAVNGTNKRTVEDFVSSNTFWLEKNIVAFDSERNELIKARNENGQVFLEQNNISERLAEKGIFVSNPDPTVIRINKYAFITDDKNRYIIILSPERTHYLSYREIVSISYEENGSNVYSKSLGGAAVGGLLFGKTGAIVGSNLSKTTQNKVIKAMSVKILLKDTSNPSILLKIYNVDEDILTLKTSSSGDRAKYENLMRDVVKIKDIFSIILDINDTPESQKAEPQEQPVSQTGIADELAKLAELKEKGYLSEKEFEAQKSKLLNM